MNKLLITLLFVGLFFSCAVKRTQVTTTDVPMIEDTKLYHVPDYTPNNIIGEWTLLGTDSFRPLSNESNEPKIEPGDVIWDFNKGDRGHTLNIMNHLASSEHDKTMPRQAEQYWTSDCLVQIGRNIYSYQVYNITNEAGDVIARDLTLDSNLDPSLPDGGMKYKFRSVDAFFACVVEEKGKEPVRPEWASILPEGPWNRTSITYPELAGQWQLSHISAFADPSQLPNYKTGDVVWTFPGRGQGYQMQVNKTNSKIEFDDTLSNGEYYFLMDQCVMKVGDELYAYTVEYKTDDNGNQIPTTLILQLDMQPGIADHTKYIFDKI